MSFIALMAAVMCVIGPFSIPLPVTAVPISFTNLIVCFTVYLLGLRAGTLSYIIYLLLGLVGLPVFSGFTGGVSKIAGPTGGYLIGMIFLALICGAFAKRFHGGRLLYAVGMTLGIAVSYALGTAWLAYQSNLTFGAALFAGVIPFIPGDAIKIVVLTFVCLPAKRLIARAAPEFGRRGGEGSGFQYRG
ncbi:MAG: biotin transporter BioY [Clostridiales Family XIII bacterium]|jgi:biotin transport system substrate-specific component|nr:biotin transporter BioY [Clostridiales Family XIII bacterium]